jgi:hypothetical protein
MVWVSGKVSSVRIFVLLSSQHTIDDRVAAKQSDLVLKGVAEAIEHCTQTHVKFTVTTATYASEMVASAKARLAFRIGLCHTSKAVRQSWFTFNI